MLIPQYTVFTSQTIILTVMCFRELQLCCWTWEAVQVLVGRNCWQGHLWWQRDTHAWYGSAVLIFVAVFILYITGFVACLEPDHVTFAVKFLFWTYIACYNQKPSAWYYWWTNPAAITGREVSSRQNADGPVWECTLAVKFLVHSKGHRSPLDYLVHLTSPHCRPLCHLNVSISSCGYLEG